MSFWKDINATKLFNVEVWKHQMNQKQTRSSGLKIVFDPKTYLAIEINICVIAWNPLTAAETKPEKTPNQNSRLDFLFENGQMT